MFSNTKLNAFKNRHFCTQLINREHDFHAICSTSLPGGNQVDGLPPASSFEECENCVPMRAWFEEIAEPGKIMVRSTL